MRADGLSNSSQLLLRNRPEIAADSLLLVNPPADGIYRKMPDAHALTLDWPDYIALKSQGEHAHFGLPGAFSEPLPDSFSQVLIFLTKAKARTRMLLEYAAAFCAPAGRVWLLGEKRSGIASAGRLLADVVGPTRKLDAARHCLLLEAGNSDPRPGPFSLKPYWHLGEFSVRGDNYPVASLPGVFSHGELDPGTLLLLENIPREGAAEALDFGSGCGIVSALVGRRGSRVTAVDTDALAIAATTKTLALNGVEDAQVIAVEGISGLARFDLIVSNPPFHLGTRTATAVTHELISRAPQHLLPGGCLLLVANTFLDYPRFLASAFGGFKVVAENSRYRVYAARPKTR